MSKQLTLIAILKAKPGKGDELGRLLNELAVGSRAEDGAINYDVHHSNEDDVTWVVYENWRSAEALEAHNQMPHFLEFAKHLPEILGEEVGLQKLTMTTPHMAPKPIRGASIKE